MRANTAPALPSDGAAPDQDRLQGAAALEGESRPQQREDRAREAPGSGTAGGEVAVGLAAIPEAALEPQRDAGDEGDLGGDPRQRGAEQSPEGAPADRRDPHRQGQRGRDGLGAVDVGEDHRLPMFAAVEREQLSPRGERRLLGDRDVGGEGALPDQRGAAGRECVLAGCRLDPRQGTDGKAPVVEATLAVDRDLEPPQGGRCGALAVLDPPPDVDRDRGDTFPWQGPGGDLTLDGDPQAPLLHGLGLRKGRRRRQQQSDTEHGRPAPHRLPFPFFLPALPFLHSVASLGRSATPALLWATKRARARWTLAQSGSAFCRRLRLPPGRFSVNLVTGASGRPSKLALRPPSAEESIRPTTSIAIPRPCSEATRSGSVLSEE